MTSKSPPDPSQAFDQWQCSQRHENWVRPDRQARDRHKPGMVNLDFESLIAAGNSRTPGVSPGDRSRQRIHGTGATTRETTRPVATSFPQSMLHKYSQSRIDRVSDQRLVNVSSRTMVRPHFESRSASRTFVDQAIPGSRRFPGSFGFDESTPAERAESQASLMLITLLTAPARPTESFGSKRNPVRPSMINSLCPPTSDATTSRPAPSPQAA